MFNLKGSLTDPREAKFITHFLTFFLSSQQNIKFSLHSVGKVKFHGNKKGQQYKTNHLRLQ